MINNIKNSVGKVLVIENDPFNICVTEAFLYLCGYKEVIIAKTSEEALQSSLKGVKFILLSMERKGPSDFKIYRRLRSSPRGKTIPIIAMAPKGKGIRTECFKAGLNGVMPKPVTLNEFKSTIKRSLGYRSMEHL